jgi:O-antigen/teichoic acid export membrane protein
VDAVTLGSAIRQGSAWIFGGNAVARLFKFGVGIVLARLLVPEDFGLLVTVQIFTGVAGLVAGGGLGEALVRARAIDADDCRMVFTTQMLISCLIYAFFYHGSPWFAVYFNEPRYLDLLRVSALSFLLRPFATTPRTRLRRAMRFRVLTLLQLVGMLVGSTTSIAMAWYGMGVWSLLLGGLLGAAANVFALQFFGGWRFGPRFDLARVRALGAYGAKSTFVNFVLYARMQAPNFIVSRVFGPAMAGLFNKAYSLGDMPMDAIAAPVYQPVFRALASVQDDRAKAKYIYLRTITLLCVYTHPVYIGLLFLAEPFIVVVYGAKWAAAAVPLQILAVGGLFRPLGNVSGAVVAAFDRLRQEMRVQSYTLVLVCVGALVGTPWGLPGVAIGLLPAVIGAPLRLCSLAAPCVGARSRDYLRALAPTLRLNGILFAVLLAGRVLIDQFVREPRMLTVLLVLGTAGALAYASAFLFLPIPALEQEVNRWRKLLRMKPVRA